MPIEKKVFHFVCFSHTIYDNGQNIENVIRELSELVETLSSMKDEGWEIYSIEHQNIQYHLNKPNSQKKLEL